MIPVVTIAVVLIALAGTLLAVALWSVRSTNSALRSAEIAKASAVVADQATACNTLLLSSIADQQLDPAAVENGRDVQTAVMVIERGNARDLALSQLRDRANALVARLAQQVNDQERRVQAFRDGTERLASRPPVVVVKPVPRAPTATTPRTVRPRPQATPPPINLPPAKPGKGKGRK